MEICLPALSTRPRARGTIRIQQDKLLTHLIPTSFNQLFRQLAAVSLFRHPITLIASTGILTSCPSESPSLQRFILRPRLTLIRLALIRKPYSYGVPVSHRDYRYLCLHLLFLTLQKPSRTIFYAVRNAPLPIFQSHNFGNILEARSLSTPGRSTSELLRTL